MALKSVPIANHRLARIAAKLCTCDLTDGFCMPTWKISCRCWRLARLAVAGVRNQANPVLAEAWPDMTEGEARARLNALCDAISLRVDELTPSSEKD